MFFIDQGRAVVCSVPYIHCDVDDKCKDQTDSLVWLIYKCMLMILGTTQHIRKTEVANSVLLSLFMNSNVPFNIARACMSSGWAIFFFT